VKLTADKISSQLKKGLAPVYFITGDETLLVGETMDAIRLAAREQGYSERETHVADAYFDWTGLRSGLNNLSLFAEKKLVEVQLQTGTPGRDGAKALTEYLEDSPADTTLVIQAPKIDKRGSATKWAKALQTSGIWVTVYSIPPERLAGWLAQRMTRAGLKFETEACEALAARVEGNLLAAQQEIDKLALLMRDQTITAEAVVKGVTDGARFDVFQLADAAISQNLGRALRVFYGLKREGTPAPLVLWALAREINTLISIWTRMDQGESLGRAMQSLRVWQSRQALFQRALRAHGESSIKRLAARTGLTDRVVKGMHTGRPWDALLELLLLLASPERPALVGPING
jgi:DNA polymerase-3 subunit delta